jgi:hypothetical protein
MKVLRNVSVFAIWNSALNTDRHNEEELLIPATCDLSSIRATFAAGFHLNFLIEVFGQQSRQADCSEPESTIRQKRSTVKNRYIVTALNSLALALVMNLTAAAQVSPTTPPPQASPQSQSNSAGRQQAAPAPAQGQEKSIDDELQLTPDQKQKIAAIVDDERKQMVAVRDDNSLNMDQKQQKAAQIRQAGSPKIRAILTQEQLQKLAAIQAREQQQQQQPPANNPSSPQAPQH